MDNLWLTNARSSMTRILALSVASSKPSRVTSHWNWRPRKLNPYFFGWFLASFICLFDYWTFLAMKEKCCSFIFPRKVYQVMAPYFAFSRFPAPCFVGGCKVGRGYFNHGLKQSHVFLLDQNPIHVSEHFLKVEIHLLFAWTLTWVLLPAHHRKQSVGNFTVSTFNSVEIGME
jgi:hypothetical protein